MSLKAQTHFNTICKVQNAYAPAPPSRCEYDTAPVSALTTPYASTPLLPEMLMLPRLPQDVPLTAPLALLMPNPLCCLSSLCLHSAPPKCLQRHPPTSLILNAAYHPYAPAAPSS
ncbi:hypothetical protein O181_038217 [Austropuccinia psidii MF-1]|uniref:Uncharacterized protein n=1 Tax=Austropuccinia psidii MF-1 TaxID=1389203 RepID=A0A9Q3DAH8_9BASI|nr:hypothetical protein [Austropuccinia psidii MF-1]